MISIFFQFCLGFVPVIDGEFVPDHPYYLLRDEKFNDVPVMVGANTGECNLYVFGRKYQEEENHIEHFINLEL